MIPDTAPLAFRCRFEKCGPIRFISHLDLTRAFHRAFARARIPLKFSEGFSPHPKFSFALPLSVGTESLCEIASFTLKPGFTITPEALKETLQAQMPAGIRIRDVALQEKKGVEIGWAEYRIRLPKADPEKIKSAKAALEGEVVIKKKTKKGKWVEKDISTGIRALSFSLEEGAVLLDATLSASGENYLKPELLLEALKDRLPDFDTSEKRILRQSVLRPDLTPFN